MSPPGVAVLGASGQIGQYLLPRLAAAGFAVLAISRGGRPPAYPQLAGVRWLAGGALTEADARGVTGLVSAGPVELAVRLAPRFAQLQRLVLFSTSSVYARAQSADAGERREVQRIRQDEARLARHCQAAGAALAVLRPTLIYGAGSDRTVSWLARWIGRFGWVPVAGRAAGRRQPVHADDLAAAAVAALAAAAPLAVDTPLCGGSTLSYREMVVRLFTALDRRPRIVALPAPLFAALAAVLRLAPPFRGLRPAMVWRQRRDLVFDDRAARTMLGYDPRPFRPSRADLEPPHAAALEALSRP